MSDTTSLPAVIPALPADMTITPDNEAMSAEERRARAMKVTDYILEAPAGTEERFKRIFQVWYVLDPNAPEDHLAALEEVSKSRAIMEDKEYGLTRASRGLAPEEEVNGLVKNAFVAIMPEKLKAWLAKYDQSLNVNINKGAKNQREAWRKCYATLHFYRVTTKQGDW
jgi:hypothetical protein